MRLLPLLSLGTPSFSDHLYRLILDDGSGEGHVYVKDLLLQQALAATTSEWAALLSVVEQCGHVVYNRNAAYALRVGSAALPL